MRAAQRLHASWRRAAVAYPLRALAPPSPSGSSPQPHSLYHFFSTSSSSSSSTSSSSGGPLARIVLNHSTHCPGAFDFLKELASFAGSDLATLVPGRLSTAKGSSERLTCKVGVPVSGGFKMIIRKGTAVQEVFVVTKLEKEGLEAHVEAVLAARRG